MPGLLDFMKSPAGQGLLSGIASYAMNARRGTPWNNFGRGLAGGLVGYNQAQKAIADAEQAKIDREYKRQMMQAQMMNAMTAAENARRKAAEAKTRAQGDAQAFERVFNVPIQVQQIGADEYDIMPAAYLSDIKNDVKQPPQLSINADMAKLYGFTPEDLNYISGLYKIDPKAAIKEMSAIRAAMRKGKAEAKDTIAKERAIAEAMGMPVGEYLRQKMNKSGVNVTVQNYGEPRPVQLPNGNQALVRFGKNPNDPPIVTEFSPPASDTEQMAAGYAQRMREAGKIIDQIGPAGNPTWGAVVAGGVAGDPGRSLLMTEAQQRHRQAQEDWVRAKLRKESGAVIADEEMEREIRTYFPQPWDKPETVEQKRKARRIAEEAMIKMAGAAMPTNKGPAIPIEKSPVSRKSGKSMTPPRKPAVGQVEDGYRFKGGDPANPASWERIK